MKLLVKAKGRKKIIIDRPFDKPESLFIRLEGIEPKYEQHSYGKNIDFAPRRDVVAFWIPPTQWIGSEEFTDNSVVIEVEDKCGEYLLRKRLPYIRKYEER